MATLINNFKLQRNPYFLFSPFLLFYFLIILLLQSNSLWGDEGRYLVYAQNLIHGYYAGSDSYLGCGPGYPIILMPFVGMHLPLLAIKLTNAVFYYLSVVLIFKVLRQIVSFKFALVISLYWALYYNAYENMPLILTETFTIFLVSALMFYLLKAFNKEASRKSNKYVYLSGFLFGYLALTKVIFGYVMLVMFIIFFILWLRKIKFLNYKKAITILVIAFITTIPYLIYTYNLTGRVFYWSTVSGNNLYWMSTPYKNEFGSWLNNPIHGIDTIISSAENSGAFSGGDLNFRSRPAHFQGFEDSVKSNHKSDYELINQYDNAIERDDAFKRIALKNIRSYPLKFIENWFSNIGRMLFNYPYSYKIQKPGTLLRLPLSGIVIVLMLFCLVPTLANWEKIDFSIRFMLLFIFVYLGGSTIGSAETRMFTIAVPILLLWIAFILNKTTTIRLKFISGL